MAISNKDAADAYEQAWKEYGLEGADFHREYRFHDTRRWRFDFAFPSCLVAVEINGMGRTMPAYCRRCRCVATCPKCRKPPMTQVAGGHQTPQGMRSDAEKLNTALLDGWRVLVFTTASFDPEHWVELTNTALTKFHPNSK